MNEELKECPFCGSSAEIEYDDGQFLVGCVAGCCIQDISDMSREEAIKMWNKRV